MEIPRHWRLRTQRYRLAGSRCPTCGQLMFPPRLVCAQCRCTGPLNEMAGDAFPVVLISTNRTDLESDIEYKIVERLVW